MLEREGLGRDWTEQVVNVSLYTRGVDFYAQADNNDSVSGFDSLYHSVTALQLMLASTIFRIPATSPVLLPTRPVPSLPGFSWMMTATSRPDALEDWVPDDAHDARCRRRARQDQLDAFNGRDS